MNLLKIAALATAILTAGIASAEGDVLYWMVDDSAMVSNGDGPASAIHDFFASYETSGDSSFAARIRVTGGDITEDTFLNLYYPGGVIDSGEFGVDFGDNGSGYWGAGVPDGNKSPSGDYSAGTPEYSFIVELGNVLYDEGTDTLSWTTVATSAAASYSSLGAYIHETFDMNPGQMAVWTPTEFTAVPEPSSGLLMTMGLALLALRRKRFSLEV